MNKPRFFSAKLEREIIELAGTEAHHLLNVRRLKVAQEIELFNGQGQVVHGRLSKIEKGLAHVEVLKRHTRARPDTEITVACAMAKGSRWNWLLEKCVELGAAGIWPVIFERSVVKNSGSAEQLSKWNNRCIEAAKQCGLAYLPRISEPRALEEIFQGSDGNFLGLVGTLDKSAEPIFTALQRAHQAQRIIVLIGPEGGLTENEQAQLEASGYQPVFLGENILRVETAAVGFLAVVRAWTDSRKGLGP